MCVLVHLLSALPYFWIFTVDVTKINCYKTIRMSRVLTFNNENKLWNKRGRGRFKNTTNSKVYLVIRLIFFLSLQAYLCGLWTDFNQTHCSSSPTMFRNWIAHLNAVAPQWPLRRRKSLDKSRSDIALLIFASIQALPEPAGTMGFILLCCNKNNRPKKHPPEGVGGGFWNNFHPCPSFFKALFYCVVLTGLYRFLSCGNPWNDVSRMTNSSHNGLKMRFALLCSASSLNLLQWNVLQNCKWIKMYPYR